MKYTSFALQSILVTFLLLARNAAGVDGSYSELTLTEQTLQAIRNCMARSPAQWPDEWNKEYVETIRSVVESHRDILQFSLRLEVLHKGFQTCWNDLTKNKERSLFEVYRTRMRWYTEHLMGSEFPTDQERQILRDQYTNIWNYATGGSH